MKTGAHWNQENAQHTSCRSAQFCLEFFTLILILFIRIPLCLSGSFAQNSNMASSRSLFLLMFLVPPSIPRSRLSLESSPLICQTGLPSSVTTESQVVNKRRNKMSNELSTGKTIIVMGIVIGCFAILWPMIFYPMLQTAFNLNSVPASRRSLHEKRGMKQLLHMFFSFLLFSWPPVYVLMLLVNLFDKSWF